MKKRFIRHSGVVSIHLNDTKWRLRRFWDRRLVVFPGRELRCACNPSPALCTLPRRHLLPLVNLLVCHGGCGPAVVPQAGHPAGTGSARHAHRAPRDGQSARPPQAPPDGVPGEHAVHLRYDQPGKEAIISGDGRDVQHAIRGRS